MKNYPAFRNVLENLKLRSVWRKIKDIDHSRCYKDKRGRLQIVPPSARRIASSICSLLRPQSSPFLRSSSTSFRRKIPVTLFAIFIVLRDHDQRYEWIQHDSLIFAFCVLLFYSNFCIENLLLTGEGSYWTSLEPQLWRTCARNYTTY